ncbi:hypothetical protein GIB67_040829 [Kingdonia uniflora]|uniref:Cell cycle checkpoint protein RAD17 n=1 Tax=Kingdonia uniflora TaxID=39325 RepID=A0A7J7P4F6_9MAGN|nr:hypothetical protein GIB67_040829 [Kingdonia uniflora]
MRLSLSSTSILKLFSESFDNTMVRKKKNDEENGKNKKRARHSLPNHNRPQQFEAFCQDFDHAFQASVPLRKRELWVDKYTPQCLEELPVHKKKVEEVKMWMTERLRNSKEEIQSHALVITGQSGVGKSATVHVTAAHLGAIVCEWNPPTPTLWQEHIHNSSSGTRYTSKLDEFEAFVARIRKYPLLPLSSSIGPRKPYVLLIDDLPLTNGKFAYGRLCNCLHVLARSARVPTIILITEFIKDDSNDNSARYCEDLKSSMERAGASKMAFNPLTVNSIKKILSKICREERCIASMEQIDRIAKASGGDIRHAITSLQYFCLTPVEMSSLALSEPSEIQSKDKPDAVNPVSQELSLPFGRDETLSLFHALGKFLHNKRVCVSPNGYGRDAFLLKERFARLPLQMDAPERVLCQAHGQGRSIADFLHENVLDFLDNESIDDALVVASYLGEADNLLAAASHGSSMPRAITSKYELESISQMAAASVAVRGVLFGNSHPSPSRWHSIRSPKLWLVERSSRQNQNEMLRHRNEACSSLSTSAMSVMATEYKPILKWLGLEPAEAFHVHNEKIRVGDKMVMDNSGRKESDDLELEMSGESDAGDDIEDW